MCAIATSSPARVTAMLGPTNTGKTYYAIERMLSHRTGVIGLPLRLLAREVYDKIVALRGPSVVALVTGEEKIIPPRAQYWVCTTEAMPLEIGADFVCVDEIQLCADPDRGHVFTDRLLRARGLHETLFLGSDTMRGAILGLIPRVELLRRDRMSALSYTGAKKISRLPERSAIVCFSVEAVYAIAELIRRTKGGCAVVMGALSPRTRNAQVAMYQNGEVDYLVATDAIGMGLNLDIGHIAFAATSKFDGRRMRALFPQELAQIAGRAGRHVKNGTFGITGDIRPIAPEVIEAIEAHRFEPVKKLYWRNPHLEFGSIDRLIRALEMPTSDPWLTRARDADDVVALKTLSQMPEVAEKLTSPQRIKLLWEVCRVPDFRGASETEHASLLTLIFGFLTGRGLAQTRIAHDWLEGAVARIDKQSGDIDTLSKRLAYIRTWTYVAQRDNWVQNEEYWRAQTRAVEDRLSDALHSALALRFVDRRTSLLLRRLKQKETLVAEVNDKGEVTVEGEYAGRLDGFRFAQDASAGSGEGEGLAASTLRAAAMAALRPELHLRADRFYNAPDTEMDFTTQGGLMWGNSAVGKLVKGAEPQRPTVTAFVDDEAGPEITEKVTRRLQHFIDRKVAAGFEPLLAMARDETLTGLARGFAFRMSEAMGVIAREHVAAEVKDLDQPARAVLRKHGIRFGQYTVFMPALLKPAPTRLRLVLWSLWNGLDDFPESPPPGLVTIPNLPAVPRSHYTLAGYHPAGARALRIDMLERLADILRNLDSRAGFEATPDMLSITGMSADQFSDLMGGLGYLATRGERVKVKAAPAPVVVDEAVRVNPITEEESVFALPDPDAAAVDAAPNAAPEMESFYTFTWAPKPKFERPARAPRTDNPRADAPRSEGGAARPPRSEGDRPQGQNRGQNRGENRGAPRTPESAVAEGAAPREGVAVEGAREGRPDKRRDFKGNDRKGGDFKGGKGQYQKGAESKGKFREDRENKPKSFEARPARPEKPIDPDNPFAALMALKSKL
jgi:ATP-dependent RNA helicase SUPV3L1/SUV3